MGGGTFGNRTSTAEFNIWADPEAAPIVFDLRRAADDGGPRRDPPVPGDTGADRTRAGAAGRARRGARRPVRTSSAAPTRPPRPGSIGAPRCTTRAPCSPSPIPTLFERAARHVVVETAGELTRGMTVIDRRTLDRAARPELRRADRRRRRRRVRGGRRGDRPLLPLIEHGGSSDDAAAYCPPCVQRS